MHGKKTAREDTSQSVNSETLGTYAYECDERVEFIMTPSADMSTIALAPIEGRPYPPSVTLAKAESASGARYEGGGIVFTARGEAVTLNEGEEAVINCSPVSVPGMAPFNFGD